ncbi:MAG: HlyC/CorC family transporter [Candidatus Saccharibacteria bacterium]|nr:HlyC/CorC family transporter [Microbacteriaceae bacterium]
MDQYTLINVGLVLLFVLIGGVFAGTEMALVSLRESQLSQIEQQSSRGAKVAELARDPNTFLAAVQIGVTVAGFLSAAYGASTLAPDVAPLLTSAGLSDGPADTVALVVMTLFIAYLSLVLGELVPKRFALQRSAGLALAVAPPLAKFATVMRPVIWLLSISTNAVVRILGGDPHAMNEKMSDEELRDLVGSHEGLEADERRILHDVFAATDRSVKEVMRPRGDVAFLQSEQSIAAAVAVVRTLPHSRYPVIGRSVDEVLGFVHVRDLLDPVADTAGKTVADVTREIVELPSTNMMLPAMTQLRREGVHIAVVIDEYGGTDGIVTLEDLVEELVGEITDEYDLPDPTDRGTGLGQLDGGLNIEDFAERTGIELEDGSYETVAGYVVDRLGRMPAVGDSILVGDHQLLVREIQGRRISRLDVISTAASSESETHE